MNDRRPRRHVKDVQRSLSFEVLFSVGIATLQEYEILKEEESKDIMSKYEHFRALTNRRLQNKADVALDDTLQMWLEWLAFQMTTFHLICSLLDRYEVKETEEKERKDEIFKARRQIKKSIIKAVMRFLQRFETDRKVDLTGLDLLLRLGATTAFDETVSRLSLAYPHDPVYWYLLIRRRIADGDYIGALAICQKALRHHPKDVELDKALRHLTLVIAAVSAVQPADQAGDAQNASADSDNDDE